MVQLCKLLLLLPLQWCAQHLKTMCWDVRRQLELQTPPAGAAPKLQPWECDNNGIKQCKAVNFKPHQQH